MPRTDDTIAALATPVGRAALAVIRISGPDTPALVVAIAGGPVPARRARHLDYRTRDGALLDDVVLTVFASPRSYTGEDAAEISCHGNPFIAQRILEDLFARGCRPARPGEFTERAFLAGRIDLSQAEAVMDLIQAQSDRALAAANQQLRGALTRRMAVLVDELLAALARIEAYIDFPEEDLPREDVAWLKQALRDLAANTDRLLATSHFGEILREGIATVLVGAPNVGKSSLLNRMVGHERALVSAEPGTTRDFIEERVMVGSHCLRVVDTAGLNPSPAPLERLGMAKTLERAAQADLFLLVLDATAPVLDLDPAVLGRISPGNAIVVVNKVDLVPSPTLPVWTDNLPQVPVSALTGAGIDDLTRAIVALADRFQTDISEDAVAISARHAHALGEARTTLASAIDKLGRNEAAELVASDLRAVLAAYGEITGRIDNERMLDALFSTFCIGK